MYPDVPLPVSLITEPVDLCYQAITLELINKQMDDFMPMKLASIREGSNSSSSRGFLIGGTGSFFQIGYEMG